MIISRLIGGIGNQMFQYACGLAVAQKHNVPLKLDLRGFDQQKLRRPSLHHFNISAPAAAPSELPDVAQIGSRLVRLWPRWYRPKGLKIIRDYLTGFDGKVFSQGSNLYLDGYWQREKYFISVVDTIRREFTLRAALDPVNQNIVDSMGQEQSVSVHVRRGDYLANTLYATCTLDYYRRAIDYLHARHSHLKLYIFSDDPDWVQTNLNANLPLTFVTNNQGIDDYKDLILMSRCKHHIIANSSFSWWGAWLSTDPTGIVIAPNAWYTKASMNTGDLVPENWIQLPT